jgi:lipoate-protein ligase B
VNTDLSYFDLIIACEGEPVTSMKELLGREVGMSAVEDRIVANFADVFEMCLKPGRGGGPREVPTSPPLRSGF